jgi:hypothetical protein
MVESTDQPLLKPICSNIRNWISYTAGTAHPNDGLRLLVKRTRFEQLTEDGNVEISGLVCTG